MIARRGQFDRQGNAVETGTDFGDGGCVFQRQFEIGLGKLGPLFEQAYGFKFPEVFKRLFNIGESKGGHMVHNLAQNAERFATGRQDL